MKIKTAIERLPWPKPQTTYTNRIALRVGKKGARFAQFGALDSVFENAMFMLWSMADAVSSGSFPIVFKVLTLNVAICIQEHRYTHSEDIKYHDTCNGWTLATASAWKNSVNATSPKMTK